MTTGVLIFAHNNEVTDYVSMAQWSAKNIQRHLGLPTHIVTGSVSTSNKRYFSDYQSTVTWHNETRPSAYDLTPWDQTIVLDADYVVASDALKCLINSPVDFLAHHRAYDVTGLNDFENLNYFGKYRMPMTWATVMIFRRSKTAELVFKMMSMVKNNWQHYRNLYQNNLVAYRNDHALSIALNVVYGHVLDYPLIPWALATVTPDHQLTRVGKDNYRVQYLTADGKSRWISLENHDFHAMGKKQLGDIVASDC